MYRSFAADRGGTQSHQFAVLAHEYGGGQQAARRLRQANLLTCGLDPDDDLAAVGSEVTQWRRQFFGVHFTAEHPS